MDVRDRKPSALFGMGLRSLNMWVSRVPCIGNIFGFPSGFLETFPVYWPLDDPSLPRATSLLDLDTLRLQGGQDDTFLIYLALRIHCSSGHSG